jgi:hypothetical protein
MPSGKTFKGDPMNGYISQTRLQETFNWFLNLYWTENCRAFPRKKKVFGKKFIPWQRG